MIRLGEPIEPSVAEALSSVDTLIHCAHDVRVGALENNVRGSMLIAAAAKGAGVRRQLFISSYSAISNAQSEYASAKRRLEEFFRSEGQSIVRPGLVVGRGGMFLKMFKLVSKSPIVPLLDGGRNTIPIVWIEDLARAVETLLENGKSGEFNMYSEGPFSLSDVLHAVSQSKGRRTVFVTIPTRWLLPPIRGLESLGIPLPVSSENLAGYLKIQGTIERSHLKETIGEETPLATMMARL